METQISREQVVDYLSHLPVTGLMELIHELEGKWGVSAVPNVIRTEMPGVPTTTGIGHQDQTEFDVKMTHVDPSRKIDVIKIVREITGLGLKESKDLVESVSSEKNPTLKSGVSKADADDLLRKIVAAGAQASIV